ncbi:MAG: hypothetical protein AAB416_03275 [Patescibacteria group bacterium]
MKQFLYRGIVSAVGAFLLGVLPAAALTVQPVVIDDITASPGETVTRAVRVKNDALGEVKLKMSIYDVEPGDDTGFPKYLTKSPESTLANWINPNLSSEIILKGGETADVPLIIAVPKNAPPGGHYAGVAFGSVSTTEQEGVSAAVSGQTAVNLALDVRGDAVEKGELMKFSTADGGSKYGKLPIEFVVKVNNSGNRHFKPTGTIEVTNMFGKSVASLAVNNVSPGGNVLPKANRSYTVKWDGGFAFGKYNAHLSLNMGKAGSAQADFSFWVLPAGLLVLWLVIALVIILILALLIKNIMMGMAKKPAA